MNAEMLSVPPASLARLAPALGLMAVAYLAIAALGAYDGYAEWRFYALRQPARIPHLMVIYASFVGLALLSAGQAARTTQRLVCLGRCINAADMIAALTSLRDALRLAAAWLLFAVSGYAWQHIMPPQ